MTITESGVRTIDGIELTPKAVSLRGPADVRERRGRAAAPQAELAGALRIFGRFGFGEGVAGHITVRDPEFPDHFWVNPFAMSFRHVRVSDLMLVNHNGDVVYGNAARQSRRVRDPLGHPPGSTRRGRRGAQPQRARQGVRIARHPARSRSRRIRARSTAITG